MVVTDRLLELIGQTVDLLEIGEFRDRLVQALHSALPCDWVAISDTGAGPDSDVEFVDPPIAAELLRIFAELAYQNPLRARAERTGDGRPYRFSDVVTPEELHELGIYQRFYRQIGLEHQLACTLPGATGRILAIVLGRKHEDFTDAERALLGDARPFLIQAYRNATRYSDAVAARPPQRGDERAPDIEALCGLGLTRRQAEVLRLLATGASERGIAAQLGLSHRTVQKHLQLCYRRLGVKTRSDASTIAWTV